MPILDLQRRMHEAGRLRIGAQTASSNGRTRPVKLDKFRLTSRDPHLIAQAAQAFGGQPQQWEDQHEVYTEARSIPVVVPPTDQALTQWYEQWSGGGCQRRCDGQREVISDRACLCDPDPAERECKPTTRLSLLLPDVSGVGLWRLESHGYYAAAELGGVVDLITSAAGRGIMLPARLRLEQRSVVRDGRTNKFAVPVLDVDAPLAQIAAAAGVRLATGSPPEEINVGVPATAPELPAGLTPVPDSAPTEPPRSAADQVAEVQAKSAAGPSRRKNSAAPVPQTGLKPRTVAEIGQEDSATPVGDLIREQHGQPPAKVTEKQVKSMGAACREAGLDDDGRHQIADLASAGRTRSTKDLYRNECSHVLAAAALIRVKAAEVIADGPGGDPALLKLDGSVIDVPFADPQKALDYADGIANQQTRKASA